MAIRPFPPIFIHKQVENFFCTERSAGMNNSRQVAKTEVLYHREAKQIGSSGRIEKKKPVVMVIHYLLSSFYFFQVFLLSNHQRYR
jgi:hypothetical protein